MPDANSAPDSAGVSLSTGLPETVLSDPPPDASRRLEAALTEEGLPQQRAAVAAIVAEYPRLLEGWAALGELSEDRIEAYAYFRVGYHRGLDTLRQSGWRGSGYVRWRNPTNRGFLRALDGLRRQAEAIGEQEEAARCADFLHQLDPDWDRRV
jgi:hypothetical protein